MQIKIDCFRHNTCHRCRRAEELMKKVLEETNLDYNVIVQERFTDDPNNIGYLESRKIHTVPTFIMDDYELIGNDALDIYKIRTYIQMILEKKGI